VRRLWPRIVIALVAVLVLAAVSLAALDLSGKLPGGLVAEPTPTPTPSRPLDPAPVAAGDVLPGDPSAAPSGATPDLPTLPEKELDRLLTGGALGPDPGAVVVDLGTGTELLSRDASTARTPASVAKLATGAAALLRLDPAARLRTRVVEGGTPGALVLVGAGDASLSSRRPSGRYFPVRASLPGLADAVAERLRGHGLDSVTLAVDDSLFTGPAVSPHWRPTYVGSGVVSPVSALSVDGGRVSPTSDVRETDPALAAGRDLARLLSRRGISVTGQVARTTATAGATEVGAVESPTVAEIVELMLQTSDNDLAEALLRLSAIGSARPGTFTDGLAVVGEVLDELGVSGPTTSLLDGSGLARGSQVAPRTLVRLLAIAGDGSRPALWHLLTGMPVAGFTGTLAARFLTEVVAGGEGAGEVRAKTGTLTGVSTLAGTATVDDRPVAFVVMANDVTDTIEARAALDRFAALVAEG
jgi:serine-type D-Ala-D-Ala carboxypeptidase/endopeptidase (penicillin-binding protein 4)